MTVPESGFYILKIHFKMPKGRLRIDLKVTEPFSKGLRTIVAIVI